MKFNNKDTGCIPDRKTKLGLPEWIGLRVHACMECTDNTCSLKLYLLNKKSAFNRVVKEPEQICPAGRWPDHIKSR